MIQRLCGAPKGVVEIRDHQTSTVKLSAPSVSSPLDTPRVPSVAMSVYIATMTHTAVTFTAYFRMGSPVE